MLKTVKVSKMKFSTGNYSEFVDEIIKLSENKKSSYVCVANAHMLVEANQLESFLSVVNNADIVTPDGMPIVRVINKYCGVKTDRVAGMDLISSLFDRCEREKKSILFMGSTEKILFHLKRKVYEDFPHSNICDSISPPFRTLSDEEYTQIIERINESNPDFVFVALGCPKQEKWMASNKGKINSCMIGLGGAFLTYADLQKRAPKWMQRWSLEWLYRFLQEPRRLFKRYLVTNALFVFYVLRWSILRNKKRDA